MTDPDPREKDLRWLTREAAAWFEGLPPAERQRILNRHECDRLRRRERTWVSLGSAGAGVLLGASFGHLAGPTTVAWFGMGAVVASVVVSEIYARRAAKLGAES